MLVIAGGILIAVVVILLVPKVWPVIVGVVGIIIFFYVADLLIQNPIIGIIVLAAVVAAIVAAVRFFYNLEKEFEQEKENETEYFNRLREERMKERAAREKQAALQEEDEKRQKNLMEEETKKKEMANRYLSNKLNALSTADLELMTRKELHEWINSQPDRPVDYSETRINVSVTRRGLKMKDDAEYFNRPREKVEQEHKSKKKQAPTIEKPQTPSNDQQQISIELKREYFKSKVNGLAKSRLENMTLKELQSWINSQWDCPEEFSLSLIRVYSTHYGLVLKDFGW